MKKKNPDNRSVSGTEITPSSGTMTIDNANAIIREEGWQLYPLRYVEMAKKL